PAWSATWWTPCSVWRSDGLPGGRSSFPQLPLNQAGNDGDRHSVDLAGRSPEMPDRPGREGTGVLSRRWALPMIGVLVALLILSCTPAGNGSPIGGMVDGVGSGWPVYGFTHTQYTVDYGDAEALRTARSAIAEQRLLQNQHIMGFGVLNPEPSPGRYDFSSLDERIALIRETGGIPV